MSARALPRPMCGVAALLGMALCLAPGIARADVPTIDDMTACNQQAREGSRNRSASPTSKDQVDAEAARRVRASTPVPPGATAVTQSEDPQIHGMDAQGATDAAYRAAYRVCMRQRGF